MPAPLRLSAPLAITMWDFSWLERRWPGAGYEDWDLALDELVARGYDAVRIDAFPHLVALDPHRTWELLPEWNTQDWGSPARTRVRVLPELLEFIAACGARGVKVALSSWFRQDADNTRLTITGGRRHGEIWVKTLRHIEQAGLLPHIVWVDLCNEWPIPPWAPYFQTTGPRDDRWRTPRSLTWIREAIDEVRPAFPRLPLTFSLWPAEEWQPGDLEFFDFFEPHIWMAMEPDYYKEVGYNYERFDPKGYENLVLHAERVYRARAEHWRERLLARIHFYADLSRRSGKALATTECWGIVDYKDWPLLDWGWVKELCELGTLAAVDTGRWAALATSNFCGPQFRGMWRDIEWHRRLTRAIRSAPLPPL